MLKEQKIEKLINGYFSDSNLKYQTFRNALYSNFSLLEISRIVVIGGLILYAYGLRKFTDIDAAYIQDTNETITLKYINSKYYIENFNVIDPEKSVAIIWSTRTGAGGIGATNFR